MLWYWPGWPRFPQLAWTSQAICSVMVRAGLATASPDFYRLANPAYGWAKRGVWVRLWSRATRVTWPDRALDARETWISISVPLEVWHPLNTMFSCTLQTISTKIVLLTSKPHPRTASIHTVNFGSSRPSPWLNLINPGMWYYNRHAYCRRNVALLSPFREQEGNTAYFVRINNYFVK